MLGSSWRFVCPRFLHLQPSTPLGLELLPAFDPAQIYSDRCLPHDASAPQVASVIDKWGSPHLRGEYLPALTAMEARASYCLTEPGRRVRVVVQRGSAE